MYNRLGFLKNKTIFKTYSQFDKDNSKDKVLMNNRLGFYEIRIYEE